MLANDKCKPSTHSLLHILSMNLMYEMYVTQFAIQVTSSIYTVVVDAYPNTTMVEQGTTLILVCRVVGVPSTTVLSYQWTCPGGYCDAGAVDPEWAARIQQGNILVLNVRNGSDNGEYICTVVNRDSTQQVGIARYTLSVEGKSCISRATTHVQTCGHVQLFLVQLVQICTCLLLHCALL